MGRVPSLGDVDLPAVLGIGLTAETRQHLWYAGRSRLLITATVEVACFCPVDHGMHPAAGAEWRAQSGAQLLDAFEAAFEKLTAWSQDATSPDVWRRRANLPQP
jgi:hypothetical protein